MSEVYLFISAVFVFAIAITITPGPNNIMLLSSGANYGYKKTLFHILGINVGYNSLILMCGLGLEEIFQLYPIVQVMLKYIGSLYLLYLAWVVLNASKLQNNDGKRKPFNFFQALIFQYVNPKGWVMAITIVTAFTNFIPDKSYMFHLSWVVAINVLVSFITATIWTIGGIIIAKFLSNDSARLYFNRIMSFLLVLSIYWLLK